LHSRLKTATIFLGRRKATQEVEFADAAEAQNKSFIVSHNRRYPGSGPSPSGMQRRKKGSCPTPASGFGSNR
jgi:hypothetical protein